MLNEYVGNAVKLREFDGVEDGVDEAVTVSQGNCSSWPRINISSIAIFANNFCMSFRFRKDTLQDSP